MPWHDCKTRHTPTNDDMDTSAGRGQTVRGCGVANTGNDGDDEEEKTNTSSQGKWINSYKVG